MRTVISPVQLSLWLMKPEYQRLQTHIKHHFFLMILQKCHVLSHVSVPVI